MLQRYILQQRSAHVNDAYQRTIDPLSSTYLDRAIDSRSVTISEISGRFVGLTCNILPKQKRNMYIRYLFSVFSKIAFCSVTLHAVALL